MFTIKRLRAVLSGAVASALAVTMLPVLAVSASAASDPLGGQPGPTTISPTMSTDGWLPVPPAGTTVDDFVRHPVLSWAPITNLPVTVYRVQISPNAEFTNNTVTLANGGLSTATQYTLPQTLPHGAYFWRVRGEDGSGHATRWSGAAENDLGSKWQFTKTWMDAPTPIAPLSGASGVVDRTFSWTPIQDASTYQFELSNNSNFQETDPAVATWICTTNQTSITPFMNSTFDGTLLTDAPLPGSCDDTDHLEALLQAGGTWYWFVRGIDTSTAAATATEGGITCGSAGTADCSLATPLQTVDFAPESASGPNLATFPANLTTSCPDTVAGGAGIPLCYGTPTFSWDAMPGANAYKVLVATDPYGSNYVHAYITMGHSFTPRDSYLDNQAGQSYYWTVQGSTYTPGGTAQHFGNTTLAAPWHAFHKASAPLPLTAASAADTYGHDGLWVTADNNETFATAVHNVHSNQLTFHWDDFLAYQQQAGIHSTQEASMYRLQYTNTGDWLTATTVDVDATHWTKIDGVIPDGGYYWRVAPLDGSGHVLSWSAPQTLSKGSVAPTVSIDEVGFLAPTSAVNLVFAAPVTGVTGSTLGLRDSTGAKIAGSLIWPSTSPTTATFVPDKPLLPGQKVIPWVTSAIVDLAGNSAAVTPVYATVDPTVDSVSAVINETWSKVASGHASGGSYAKAAGVRDSISFTVNGSKLSLLGVTTPDGGYATVSVDGVPRKTANFYSKATKYGVSLYSVLLSEGKHTVTVSVKGSHAKGSKGNAVNVDALKVDGKVVQQSSAVQAWSRHRSTDAFKGSYDAESSYVTTWHGSKPTLSTSFAGSAVHVMGCKSPDAGNFGVYVDGKLKATVNGFQKFTRCGKTLVKLKGLSAGAHTITIAALGTHAKTATGTKVSVDAIIAG